jgi:triacylglycerol lipase
MTRVTAKLLAVLFAAAALQASVAADGASSTRGTVVVLHGLARSSASMSHMVRALEKAGYHVCNIAYPSREHSIEVLTTQFVAPAVRACLSNETDQAHFVTHSMGGVVVRQLAKSATDLKIGRVVSFPARMTARSRSKVRSWKA